MLKFKKFINENKDLERILQQIDEELIIEKKDALGHGSDAVEGKVSANTQGVMHELLTGYHLNGGKHMEKHPDINGDSPEQAHDKLKATLHPNDYKKLNDKAKSAAADIKAQAEKDGHKIHSVHWTSKPGDLHRSTNIEASQKEDASDVVVRTHHASDKKKEKPMFHGVSLKSGKDKNVPTSSLGIESSGPKARDTFEAHRKGILTAHPALKSLTNKADRKEWMKANPKAAEDIKKRNQETLHKVAKDLHHHLTTGSKETLVHHVRELLHAHKTPMEEYGHNHIRHITYENKKGIQHHSVNPGNEYEHILKHPEHIEVSHSGGSLSFKDKRTGKTFARHSMKYDSQSDPMSPLKSAGMPA